MLDSLKESIKSINETFVTPDDLSKVIDEVKNRKKNNEHGQGDPLYITNIKFPGQPQKSLAVHTRITALVKLIYSKKAPGWTEAPNSDGAVWTRGELIEVAASYPLSEIDGDFGFEVDGFLAKALQLVEVEGSG